MQISPLYIAYGLAALCVVLLVEGIYYVVVDVRGRRHDPNERLRLLSAGASREDAAVLLRRERSVKPSSLIAWFDRLVIQTGIGAKSSQVALIMLLVTVIFGCVTLLFQRDLRLAIMAGIGAGVLLPLAFLYLKRRARLRRFEQQLSDAIEMAVRGLRAGHPVQSAIGIVAREMPDPIGSEFGIAMDEMTYGLELDRALKNMQQRVGLEDLNFLVVAVTIQTQLGGNLAEVLSNLARVIRDRLRMRLKIKAASAEGRFSAIILSIMPFALFGIISFINPSYYGDVNNDPLFWPGLEFAFVLMVFGIIVMYRMVNFRV
jgi:tight adherence protein B